MALPVNPKQSWPPLRENGSDLDTWAAWYSGDPQRLASDAQPQQNRTARLFFWKRRSPVGKPQSGLHMPLAGELASVSADLLFGDAFDLTVADQAAGKRLDELRSDTGKAELTIVPIEADERVQQRLIAAASEFWQKHVERGVAPDPIGTEADAGALARMWPETIPEPAVTIEDELAEVILSDYLAHRFKSEEHAREAEAAKQRLQALMGESEQAVIGHWKLTWKQQVRTTIDSKRLKRERPEVAAEYAKTTLSRVFAAPKEINS